MIEKDLTITQGDERSYNLVFWQDAKNTVPLDITGATVTMTVKRSLDDSDAKISKIVTEHTDASSGKTTITLTTTDTSIDLGTYFYDIQISGGSIGKITVLKGKLIITWQATED